VSTASQQEGDLKHQIDHGSLYSTVVKTWWGLPATAPDHDYQPIDCPV
jgi:hypothetical protein